MIKTYSFNFAILFFAALFSSSVFGQVYRYPKNLADQNPFARKAEIRGNSELFLVYDSLSSSSYIPNQRIYDYANIPTTNQAWLRKQRYNGAPNNNGNRKIAIASGDFNGDFKDDVVEAWEGPAQGILITIPNIPLNLNVNGYTQITNPGPLAIATGANYIGRIRLATGDFDGDGKSEFVIAYRNRNDLKIHLDLYDVDSATFNMTLVASIADETLPQTAIAHECFDITARDLNADGVAEIVLASAQYATNGYYKVYNKIYQVVKSTTVSILPKAKRYIDSTHVNTFHELNISVGAGDFNGDIAGEILTVYGYIGNSVAYDTWMNITRPADDSLTNPGTPDWFEALLLSPKSDSALYSVNQLETFCVAIGDLNKDGHDDIVVGLSGQFKAYKVDSVFNFVSIGGASIAQNYDGVYYDSYTTLGDVNQDGKIDVINVRNAVSFGPPNLQSFYIEAHTLNSSGTGFNLLANNDNVWQYQFSNTNEIRHFAITSGDFDGDRLRFRTGRHYEVANVVQPLVTLNAPPVHFDFVPDNASTPFDVCGCFPDPVTNCPFYSSYTQATSNSLTLETQLNSDWSVSASVSLGASIGPVDVGLELETSYGKKFNNTNSSTITVKTTQGSSAYFDDQYYATITTYTVWEYPIYVGDTLICYAASFVPKSTNDLWVSATAIPVGDGFYSKHEPGHILSYRPSGTEKDVKDSIYGNSGWVVSQTLGPKNIGVTLSQIQTSTTGTTETLNLKASAKVGAFGQSVGMSGGYNYETVSTQTVSAETNIDINTFVNSRSGIGGDYTIIPYFGWGHDGAITLDYQVDPSGPWWATYYTTPDPALLLPLHLFPEMGFTLPSPEYRTRTKSLTLDRRDPQLGDTLNMTARIFNYSKSSTPDTVEVRFYYGDPDNGGTLITNVQGQSTIKIVDGIEAQGFDSLEFRFVMQPPTGYFDHRIFVVIDPDHKMLEVHENNNKGWIGMGAYFPLNIGIDELTGHGFNSSFTLWQNWPNPAKDITYMKVEVHKGGNLSINVYNTQGALVKTIVDNNIAPGEYTFSFDASKLANGIYYYTAKSAGITDTYKMVVLH